MPRRPRVVLPNIPLHIIQRGNNRQACFCSDEDYLIYLEWLKEYADKSKCQIHAYVLMTNHVHLLLTPGGASSAGEPIPGEPIPVGTVGIRIPGTVYLISQFRWEFRAN